MPSIATDDLQALHQDLMNILDGHCDFTSAGLTLYSSDASNCSQHLNLRWNLFFMLSLLILSNNRAELAIAFLAKR